VLTKCRNTFHFPCKCREQSSVQQLPCSTQEAAAFQPPANPPLRAWQPSARSGGGSLTVTSASCHGWPELPAIDQRSCRTGCQYPAGSGQGDESAGTELIESQSYRHPPETGVGHSDPCLWHRSAAFVLKHLFPRMCSEVISSWHIKKMTESFITHLNSNLWLAHLLHSPSTQPGRDQGKGQRGPGWVRSCSALAGSKWPSHLPSENGPWNELPNPAPSSVHHAVLRSLC